MIAVEASPVSQYDLMKISGNYSYCRHLSANMGTEGVGRAIAVGNAPKTPSSRLPGKRVSKNSTRRRLKLPETVTDMLIERSDDNG